MCFAILPYRPAQLYRVFYAIFRDRAITSGVNEQYIALNGCPAKCASKEFDSARIKPHEEIIITKDFDPKNNEKYAELLYIDEEVFLVQELIDRLLGSK